MSKLVQVQLIVGVTHSDQHAEYRSLLATKTACAFCGATRDKTSAEKGFPDPTQCPTDDVSQSGWKGAGCDVLSCALYLMQCCIALAL